MPRPLLLLHERHTPDDSDIWRVAVRRGWTTERVNRYNVKARMEGFDHIRYYGNLLHWDFIHDQVPLRMLDLGPELLASLDWVTKRRIQLMRYGELAQPLAARSFVKPTCVKWFEARVYQAGETIVGSPEINDFIYVQDPVEYLDEVRCFCLDGQVLTSSLYRINKVVYSETGLEPEQVNMDGQLDETPIREYVRHIYAENPGMPRAVVADFGRHPDGSWSLIEFNEPWCSGLYYCDPERCFDCIVETQVAVS